MTHKIPLAKIVAALPPDWRVQLREERQSALQAAKAFARICEQDEAEHLYDVHLLVNESGPDAWRLVMRKVARLEKVSARIQKAFIAVWVEHKGLSSAVGDRRICAAGLRVLLPKGYKKSITLYRGDNARKRRIHGFSWTSNIETARIFAKKNMIPPVGDLLPHGLGGVVLRTVAPACAILLIREHEDYYEEDEVVVDPYQLSKVEIIERLPAIEAGRC